MTIVANNPTDGGGGGGEEGLEKLWTIMPNRLPNQKLNITGPNHMTLLYIDM
jgi:hypothetical protein